jgi:hypothetical protein
VEVISFTALPATVHPLLWFYYSIEKGVCQPQTTKNVEKSIIADAKITKN